MFRDSGVYAFEAASGSNGTWRLDTGLRAIPREYQHLSILVTDDGAPFSGCSLTLDIHEDVERGVRDGSQPPFVFQQSDPECFCFSDEGSSWRRLWTGGDVGSGTLTVTPTDVVFVKSTAAQRMSCCGPQPATVDDLERVYAAQGGVRKPRADVLNATLSYQGYGTYGSGRAEVADVTVTDATGQTLRFRFLGHDRAGVLLRILSPRPATHRRARHS